LEEDSSNSNRDIIVEADSNANNVSRAEHVTLSVLEGAKE
jgi:hypothetical protein